MPKFWLYVLFMFIIFHLGCTRSEELAVVRQLRCVRIGLMNYESWHGKLPKTNRNHWRFSSSTKFSVVSWRGVVLESIEGLGAPKDGSSVSQQVLEASIDNAGQRAFELDGKIVCLNPLIQGHTLSNLPPKMVIAFLSKKDSALWYEDQTEDMSKVYETIESNEIALLLGDGTVGFSRSVPRTFLEQIFSLEAARNVFADDFLRCGFRIHESK